MTTQLLTQALETVLAAAPAQTAPQALTEDQKYKLVQSCGLYWNSGYMPMFSGDKTNRFSVLIEAVEAHCGITAPKGTT
jgi:hypothetical protein